MKNFKTILLLILVTSVLNRCTDHVDYEAIEGYQITSEIYFQQEADYDAALVGTYDVLQWLFFNIQLGAIASEISLCGGESATDYIGIQQIDDMTHYPENNVLRQVWQFLYEGVNRANYMEENKANIDFDGKESMYGEVYFLRAYYYFELVKFFGDVPLFTEARLTAGEAGTLTRTPKEEVYAQIELDLQNAIASLPDSQSQVGRVNKYTAYALLGKVLLYQDKFAEAASALDNVIGVYSLVSDYGSQFLRFGENGPESVFEIQYSNQSNWYDWGCAHCSEGNYAIIMNGPRGWSGPEYAQGWSFNVPTAEFYNSFEEGDTRRDATILDIEAFAAATGANYTEGYDHTGYFNNKYIPRAGESGGQTELNYLSNFRIIRYSDVLLMAAEAHANNNDSSKAIAYLNQVRARAFGDNSQDYSSAEGDLINAIIAERRLELAAEGHYFFDLVRTGKAKAAFDDYNSNYSSGDTRPAIQYTENKNEFLPIPLVELELANAIDRWGQNEGY